MTACFAMTVQWMISIKDVHVHTNIHMEAINDNIPLRQNLYTEKKSI